MLLLEKCNDNKKVYTTLQLGHLYVGLAKGGQPTKKLKINCKLKYQVFFISSMETLSGYERDLQDLNITGTYQGEPCILPPS